MKENIKKILKYIKENLFIIITLIIIVVFGTVRLPYTVESPGGLIPIEERLSGDIYLSKGSLNLTYVSTRNGNIPSLIMGLILPSWDIVSNKDITYDNEDIEIANIRSAVMLKQAISSATSLAYAKAGKEITINKEYQYITYIFEEAETELKVGDLIIEVDGDKDTKYENIVKRIQKKKKDDYIKIKVLRNNKEIETKSKILEVDGIKMVGIEISRFADYNLDPKIEYETRRGELGSSGGLMLSLAIYNALTEDDLTKGRTIAGTGTIDYNGEVGEIDGVKYKLAGAVKNKAEIFIVPKDNYKEAEKLVKKNKYKIKLIKADNFDQVLEELNK